MVLILAVSLLHCTQGDHSGSGKYSQYVCVCVCVCVSMTAVIPLPEDTVTLRHHKISL